jgi:hypothetical protein
VLPGCTTFPFLEQNLPQLGSCLQAYSTEKLKCSNASAGASSSLVKVLVIQ